MTYRQKIRLFSCTCTPSVVFKEDDVRQRRVPLSLACSTRCNCILPSYSIESPGADLQKLTSKWILRRSNYILQKAQHDLRHTCQNVEKFKLISLFIYDFAQTFKKFFSRLLNLKIKKYSNFWMSLLAICCVSEKNSHSNRSFNIFLLAIIFSPGHSTIIFKSRKVTIRPCCRHLHRHPVYVSRFTTHPGKYFLSPIYLLVRWTRDKQCGLKIRNRKEKFRLA